MVTQSFLPFTVCRKRNSKSFYYQKVVQIMEWCTALYISIV